MKGIFQQRAEKLSFFTVLSTNRTLTIIAELLALISTNYTNLMSFLLPLPFTQYILICQEHFLLCINTMEIKMFLAFTYTDTITRVF